MPLVVTDFATAELVKVAANAFLATKISFINAMAEVCEAAGGDVTQLARAIGYDPRIGNRFLQAGVGFGGGCLPKDIRAFQARAQELGAGEALRFLHEVDLINQRRRDPGGPARRRPARPPVRPGRAGPRPARASPCSGATFKPNTDDVRDAPGPGRSPRMLARAGADVHVYDPEGMENARRDLPDVDLREAHDRRGHRRRPGLRAHRVGRVPQRRPGRRSASWSPAGRSSTAATASTRRCGRRAGWEYRGMGRPVVQ